MIESVRIESLYTKPIVCVTKRRNGAKLAGRGNGDKLAGHELVAHDSYYVVLDLGEGDRAKLRISKSVFERLGGAR